MKIAIVAGIAEYSHLLKLPACVNDGETVKKFLEETKSYTDICFLQPNADGKTAKRQIVDFVNKYKGNSIDEVFFYFSGHGDRTQDEFYYLFSDYQSSHREKLGLSNTELDILIRNLRPELTIKIVDACYSGSMYIKSDDKDDNLRPMLLKSAQDNQLKKLYFFHSSAADQPSMAGPNFSHFTLELLRALIGRTGAVRYRDLMDAVADEMRLQGGPSPIFVTQADNLEIFVDMQEPLSQLLRVSLGLADPTGADAKDSDAAQSEPSGCSEAVAKPETMSIKDLASLKASESYCSEEEARKSLELINDAFVASGGRWPKGICDAYEIVSNVLKPDDVPNKAAIGNWISSLKDDFVFADTTREEEIYEVEEYKPVPKRPISSGMSSAYAFARLSRLFDDDNDYKLVTVNKQREVISGFQYTADPIFAPHLINFIPKVKSLERYAVLVVALFSRRTLTCLYSREHLRAKDWSNSYPAKAENWKRVSALLKNSDSVNELTQSVISDVVGFIEADARRRLA